MNLSNVSEKPPHVLLVEDDLNDAEVARRAFERAGLKHSICHVPTGMACLAYLKGEPPYNDRDKYPLPTLVLLDIKLPMLDGFDVLRWIRSQSQFAKLCVVMLTASDEIRDANTAYQLGATSFLVKPLDFWNAGELARTVERLMGRC